MKILSLDQCYLRSMSSSSNAKPAFVELKTAIINAVDSSKLMCPAHAGETVFESSLLPQAKRELVFAFQNRISNDYGFLQFSELLGCETLALVRPQYRFEAYKRIQPLRDLPELRLLASANRKAKQDYNERIEDIPYPPADHSPSDGLKETYQKILHGRVYLMHQVVEHLLRTGNVPKESDHWECAAMTGRFLAESNITALELVNLRDKILNRQWEAIPILGINTLLYSRIEGDILATGRKLTANDFVDISRLSVAILCADAIACDIPMKEAARQTKIDGGTLVFSMREPDALLQWVKSL